MKVAVIGGNGQLGVDVVAAFTAQGDDVVALTHEDIELADIESVKRCLNGHAVDLVVNTAAMHKVDMCEQEPAQAYAVNAIGTRNLAIVTNEAKVALVHTSTDYVFGGTKEEPYVETDTPCPVNVYGNSKLAGEYFARSINPRHFVLRISALYGKHPCRAKGGLNFVELMLKLGRDRGRVRVVYDEMVSPTPTADVARQIVALSRSDAFGLYHATAEGSCSWYEFAKEIFSTAGMKVEVEIAAPGEFAGEIKRPHYSVLENRSLKNVHLNKFQHWKIGLTEYLCGAPAVLAS